jgi:hypothetical protein
MNPFATVALVAAVSLSSVALQSAAALPAAPVSAIAAPAPAEAGDAAFLLGGPLVPGRPSRLDRVDVASASAAVESYFDFDALISLGALVLCGGGMAAIAVAAARRKAGPSTGPSPEREEEWRESVFQAIQADLLEFTQDHRRAA